MVGAIVHQLTEGASIEEIEKAKLEDLKTTMLLIKGRAQIVADKEEFYQQVAAIMQEQGVQLRKVYIMKRGYHLAQYEAMMTNGRTIQTMKLPVPIEGEPEEEYVVEIVEA